MTRYDALGEIAIMIITAIATLGLATAGLLAIEGLRHLKARWSR